MEVIEYPKIPGPFNRAVSGPSKNKVIAWDWSSPELEFLADVPWKFTEKVDGTNIRVIWDGHKPEFRGRTDNAQLPAKLLNVLAEMFPEELFEQKFGSTPVILFGEGYGANIQRGGGNYRQDVSFILFDVKIDTWWLRYADVCDVAKSLGIDYAPVTYEGTLRNAITYLSDVTLGRYVSQVAETYGTAAEGWVGTPSVPLWARDGSRIMVKLKTCDLYGLELD